MHSWRETAEYYLEQWCNQDQYFVRKFSVECVSCETLREFFYEYGVARTIPGRVEELGAEKKYRPLADMFNRYHSIGVTRENAARIIDEEVQKMREKYQDRRLWSAISKGFWMAKRHPVVVYDNTAWRGLQSFALKPGYDTYRQYFDSWFTFFEREDTTKSLDDAISWLLSASPYGRTLVSTNQLDAVELKGLCESQWFRNRVTDIYLCCRGGANVAKWKESLKYCHGSARVLHPLSRAPAPAAAQH